MDQAAIAKAVRMSQQSYSDLETGKSKSTTRIGSLAAVLQVDALWLETGEGEERPERIAEAPPTYLLGDRRELLDLYEAMSPAVRKALLVLLKRK